MGKRSRDGEETKKGKTGKKRSKISVRDGNDKQEPVEDDDGAHKHPNDSGVKEKTEQLILLSTTSASHLPRNNDGRIAHAFFRRRVQLAISLLPSSLRNCEQAVENSIRKKLLRYSDGFGGILVAYDDVQLRDEADDNSRGRGWILNELPYIHYNVSCQALVFAPSVGCELQGVVNECFPSHVGLLVFDYINAMVSAETIQEVGYTFDPDLQTWTKEEGSLAIACGNKINFVVSKVHECDGTISLEGVKPARSLLVES